MIPVSLLSVNRRKSIP